MEITDTLEIQTYAILATRKDGTPMDEYDDIIIEAMVNRTQSQAGEFDPLIPPRIEDYQHEDYDFEIHEGPVLRFAKMLG